MNEKEKTIELEQILEEERLKLKELSEDELTKVSGGNSNGIAFKKGKWIQMDDVPPSECDRVYELTELQGVEVITDAWLRYRLPFGLGYDVSCLRGHSLPIEILQVATEISRPDWAHE